MGETLPAMHIIMYIQQPRSENRSMFLFTAVPAASMYRPVQREDSIFRCNMKPSA